MYSTVDTDRHLGRHDTSRVNVSHSESRERSQMEQSDATTSVLTAELERGLVVCASS